MKKIILTGIITIIYSATMAFAGGNTEEWTCPSCSNATYITMPTINYTDDYKVPPAGSNLPHEDALRLP